MDNKLNVMFKNICCSRCKSDFGEESIEVLRQEEAMLVIRLNCIHCGKTFGVAFLGVEDLSVKDFEEDSNDFVDEDKLSIGIKILIALVIIVFVVGLVLFIKSVI